MIYNWYINDISASPLRLGGERPAAWNQLFPGFPPSCMSSPLAAKTTASYHRPPLNSNSGLPYSSLRPPIFQLRSLLYPISLLPSPKKLPNNLPATKKMTKYLPPAPLHPSKPEGASPNRKAPYHCIGKQNCKVRRQRKNKKHYKQKQTE